LNLQAIGLFCLSRSFLTVILKQYRQFCRILRSILRLIFEIIRKTVFQKQFFWKKLDLSAKKG